MENPMPAVTVPQETFRRLSEKATALNISVEEFVKLALDRFVEPGACSTESLLPLTGDAWWVELDAWKRDAEKSAERYPPGFVLDDSRETMYREREDSQR
jgi:hypothetical protein